jgi:nucleoside-diphosphate-sugar epimerase
VIHSAQTIILTGATGYVGRRILDRLLARGDRVIALVRNAARLERADPGLTVVEVDLGAPLPPLGDLRADALVHAGACTDFDAGLEQLMRVNRDGTRRVAALAVAAGVRRAVYVSSDHASGPAAPGELPQVEGVAGRPATDYGRSKLAGEQAFTEVCDAAAIEPTILRPCVIVGEGGLGFIRILLEAVKTNDAMLATEWNTHR